MPRVSAPITPTNVSDTFPTHDSIYSWGGWREVATVALRNAIPNERRKQGMPVYVSETDKNYQLLAPQSVDALGVGTWLGTNADWRDLSATPSGPTEGLFIEVEFPTPILEWEADHPYHGKPKIILLDVDGQEFYGEKSYPAESDTGGTVLASFDVPMAGTMVIRS